MTDPHMNDSQLLRYSRHILLDELGIEGQEQLLASRAFIVGAGGLGSPVALYLGSAGVGYITVVDHDTVDATNLQRQIAHTLANVGKPKAQSIQEAIDAINRACVQRGKPLVSGAAIRFDGQITVYDPRDAESPCYACVFPETDTLEEAQCATMGVFAPLVGIIGSVQAAEALKLLMCVGQTLTGRLLMLDGRNMAWSEFKMPRNPTCAVCSAH